jgi:predicted secreted hydrolase
MLRSLTIVVLLSLLILPSGCGQKPRGGQRSLEDLFATSRDQRGETEVEVWSEAVARREFQFPSDHAAHSDFRIEWWYYTGNLQAEDGRRFGYQLTFFRTGLHKEPENPSAWTLRDLYTAHFAVSDIGSERHYCFQRNSRRGVGQADARTDRFEVWNGQWRAWLEGEQYRLRAEQNGVAVDLVLSPTKQPILHGDGGLSQKGPTVGNASYYYSLTRLRTNGTLSVDGQTCEVRGESWMDHEFSTSFLEPGQVGWDWLAIQLDDGTELMLYQMRRDDGSQDSHSSGSFVSKEGDVVHLSSTQYDLSPLDTWTSEQTGAVYPLSWDVRVPSLGYRLRISPAFDAQEMTTAQTTGISYWEGAIDVQGSSNTGSVNGQGYMELTGYQGQGLGSLFE